MQNWIDKLAQTQHNLEELQIEIEFSNTENYFDLVELCQNNKNIKVLVLDKMIISEDSCRAIAANCRKLEELEIIFPTSEQNSYDRYFIN